MLRTYAPSDSDAENYAYDLNDRLTQTDFLDGSLSGPLERREEIRFDDFYSLIDRNGNRIVRTMTYPDPVNGDWVVGDMHYYAAGTNRLQQTSAAYWDSTINDDPKTVLYDNAGNITKYDYTNNLGDFEYTYGDSGRPRLYRYATQFNPPLYTTTMTHNALGQRVHLKTTGTNASAFPEKVLIYDEAGHIIAEHWAGGAKLEHVYLDDIVIAFVHYDGATGGGTGTLHHYARDHLKPLRSYSPSGSVSSLDANYGIGITAPRNGYPGQYYLPETGMYYNYVSRKLPARSFRTYARLASPGRLPEWRPWKPCLILNGSRSSAKSCCRCTASCARRWVRRVPPSCCAPRCASTRRASARPWPAASRGPRCRS
jgi:hypothetical protein